MADSQSELESDASSVEGGFTIKTSVPLEQLNNRVESLLQENKVLKLELDQYKTKHKSLVEENTQLRHASVKIQAQAEQEEEFISNTLLKQIEDLKKEKETLAKKFEQEEEFLTNDLSRRLVQLRHEKAELEMTLEKEQEHQVNKLMRRIDKLQAETTSKQNQLEKLHREKVELENTLEHEQEALVNRLWKKMEKLEGEKRMLQERLDQPVSGPPSPRDMQVESGDVAGRLAQHIQSLRSEVYRLRSLLHSSQTEQAEKIAQFEQEERQLREEKVRLERKLQREIERREALCRHLSESESSLEMDEERCFNEYTKQYEKASQILTSSANNNNTTTARQRASSSPLCIDMPLVTSAHGQTSPGNCSYPYGHHHSFSQPGSTRWSHVQQSASSPLGMQTSSAYSPGGAFSTPILGTFHGGVHSGATHFSIAQVNNPTPPTSLAFAEKSKSSNDPFVKPSPPTPQHLQQMALQDTNNSATT